MTKRRKTKPCRDCGKPIKQSSKRCHSCARKASWAAGIYGNTEYRDKMSVSLQLAWAKGHGKMGSKEHRKRLGIGQKARYQKPGASHKQAEAIRALWQQGVYDDCFDEASRRKNSEAVKAVWQKSEYRQKWTESRKELWTPELRNQVGKATKERWEDEEFRRMQSGAGKARWKRKEFRQKVLRGVKEAWENPELRQAQSEKTKAAHARGAYDGVYKSPSSLELSVAQALDDCGILYVQQYRLDGTRKHFDFFVPSTSRLIEVDGTYWHSKPEAKKRDRYKNKLAQKHGFILLRIPEKELEETGALEVIREKVLPITACICGGWV